MQATSSRLVLSPSDLNDYVECPHLTTLAREVARGTRRRPHVPEDHADLLRRKGEEHEAAYLAGLRAQGRQVVDVIGADPWDFDSSERSEVDRIGKPTEQSAPDSRLEILILERSATVEIGRASCRERV